MFDHFRSLFIYSFQINATILYLIGLSIRFCHNALLLMVSLLTVIATFKSYPSVGDVSLILSLLPLWTYLFYCKSLNVKGESSSEHLYLSFRFTTRFSRWCQLCNQCCFGADCVAFLDILSIGKCKFLFRCNISICCCTNISTNRYIVCIHKNGVQFKIWTITKTERRWI